MPSFANALLGATVTMPGAKPFTSQVDTRHGTIGIYDNAGVRQKVTLSQAATVGYQAAVTETTGFTIADNAHGRAIAAEILSDFNA